MASNINCKTSYLKEIERLPKISPDLEIVGDHIETTSPPPFSFIDRRKISYFGHSVF